MPILDGNEAGGVRPRPGRQCGVRAAKEPSRSPFRLYNRFPVAWEGCNILKRVLQARTGAGSPPRSAGGWGWGGGRAEGGGAGASRLRWRETDGAALRAVAYGGCGLYVSPHLALAVHAQAQLFDAQAQL